MNDIIVCKKIIYISKISNNFNLYFFLYNEEKDFYTNSSMDLLNTYGFICLSNKIKIDFNIRQSCISSGYSILDTELLSYEQFRYFYLFFYKHCDLELLKILDFILFSWQ